MIGVKVGESILGLEEMSRGNDDGRFEELVKREE